MDKNDFEPMDVDRSASSVTSQDDIFYVDDNYDIIRKRNAVHTGIKIEKAEPDSLSTSKAERAPSPNITFSDPEKHDIITEQRQKSNIKTYHIKRKPTQHKQELSSLQRLFYGSLLAVIAMIAVNIINFKCAEEIDLTQLRKSFSNNLFGQTAAANKILTTLTKQDKTKILFLYGGTGVGKTYAISMMLEGLWTSANIYHYTMPMFNQTFSTDLMIGLSICHHTVFVVDDLTVDDMDIKPHIQTLIEKSEKMRKNITIVLAYNCDNITANFVKKCDNNFQHNLEETFRNVKALKEYIKFEPLTQKDLVSCIEKELGDRKVNAAEMKNVLKNFDVSLDGCKGVHKKIKHLNAA